jgi:uncharacterized SAM-binding protein YcdF (DUF218 family)
MTHIEPGLTLLLLLGAAGLLPFLRRKCWGRWLTPLALAALFLWSWPPVAHLFSWTLERQYSWTGPPSADAQAMVVLTGGIEASGPSRPRALAGTSTYRRTMYAAWLYRHWRPLPVLISGGSISETPTDPPVSALARDILLGEGLPEDDLWLEKASLSTHTNALHTAELLRGREIHKIALVTESVHMPRSILTFRKQGVEVVPAPCCAVSAGELNRWTHFLPTRDAIESNEAALHEWVGLAWYWVTGRI